MDVAYRVFRSNLSEVNDLLGLAEIIPGRLYLAIYSSDRSHLDTSNLHFFVAHAGDGAINKPGADTRNNRVYEPVDVGRLAEYIRRLNGKMYDRRYESKAIVHYCATVGPNEQSGNAALLVGAYAIAAKRMDPRTVFGILKDCNRHVDANYSIFAHGNNNTVDLYDYLSAVHKAVKYRLVDFNDFSCQKYYEYSDLTWIVPNKLIAFRGPVERRRLYCHSDDLQRYVEYFRKNNVKTVIRLNCPEYDSSRFSDADIEHVDLYFEDGTAPSNVILQTFLNVSELTPDAIAVHCKAGLGRTGTLIAAYLVQHYRMTAREAVAWMRLCRPGSVTGPQQSFLMNKENALWKNGDAFRKNKYGNAAKVSYCDRGIYSVNSRTSSTLTAVSDWNAMYHRFGYLYRRTAFSAGR